MGNKRGSVHGANRGASKLREALFLFQASIDLIYLRNIPDGQHRTFEDYYGCSCACVV